MAWIRFCFAALLAWGVVGLSASAGVLTPQPHNWRSVPWGGAGFVDGFIYHPKAKDVLYARTDMGGFYRFDFTAKRWIALTDHIPHADADLMGVLSVALDPKDPDKVYIACGLYLSEWARKGAILRSSDRGKTWEKAELPIRIGGNSDGRGSGDRLIVDPHNSSVIWYGSNQNGLWKSSDGGKTFNKSSSPATSISFILADPNSRNVWLGSADGDGALLLSKDGADSFERVAETPRMVPQHAALAPDGSLYVTFAAGSVDKPVNPSFAERGAVWKRSASGNWSEVSPLPAGNFGYSGIDVGPDGAVAVSTLNRWYPGDDIFLSRDGAAHWLALGAVSKHDASPYPWLVHYTKGEDRMGHWLADVKINPFNKDEMIYGTGYGLWMSRNLSAAGPGRVLFDFAVEGLEEAATLQLVSPPVGPRVMAAFGDIGGAAWSDISKTPSSGLFTPTTETNYSIDYAGLKQSFMVRVTNNTPTHAMISVDAAQTWAPIAATPYKSQEGAREWHSPGVMAISAKATALVWVPQKDAAYYSHDGGMSWKESSGWPSGRDAQMTVVADKVADRVFYAFDRFQGMLLASIDGGASFTPIADGLWRLQGWESYQLAVVPGRFRDVWIAMPQGLVHSPDASSPISNARDVDAAWQVGFGAPKTPGGYPAVYLAGKVKGVEGLWRSDDAGANWTRINDDAHQFGHIGGITGDMREYGVVYIAPGGRGVLVGTPGN